MINAVIDLVVIELDVVITHGDELVFAVIDFVVFYRHRNAFSRNKRHISAINPICPVKPVVADNVTGWR